MRFENIMQKGKHEDGSETIVLTVRICKDTQGLVWSAHSFEEDKDSELAAQWPGGGVRHVAHGLLQEAVRREAFVSAIIEASKGLEYITGYQKNKEHTVQDLASKIERVLTVTIPKLSQGAAQEVLEMLYNQLDRVEERNS